MDAITVQDAIAASVSAHRENGCFVKANYSGTGADKMSNKDMLYKHFYGSFNKQTQQYDRRLLKVTEQDTATAADIIYHFKGLSLKALERKLSDFERNVLRLVNADEITNKELGITASLPQVYFNSQEQETWEERERELTRTSEYVGEIRSRCTFNAMIENIRYMPKLGSALICCSVDDKHILKFWRDTDIKEFKVGDTVIVTGFVKSHQVSKYHGGKETMINRIKVGE